MALTFKLVGAAAAMSSVLIVLAERGLPKPPAAVPDAIAERWPDDPPAAPKADRLALAATAEAVPATEVGPARVPVATVTHLPATPTTRKRDICQRHGMHKQVTRGGRSWRCR